ncbi:Extracellular solute-binding protein family 1 [Mycena venus]|uniref:Extracellular solute-binding protein family 1 n=1 Tax=Mycena venus TaxID=2733690 RepID=A0A8H6XPA8_9AGAR|nr:Extracellular solute-binding protein family 1 [Mycena venus]
MPSMTLRMFAGLFALAGTALAAGVQPQEIYDGGFHSTSSPIPLRIGNGGAGQSGLVKALADAFIQECVKNGSEPFRVAWVLSDNTFTVKYLQSGDADVGITYNPASEKIAGNQGIIDPVTYYIFRDHFLITGPLENPANVNRSDDILTIFANLFHAADTGNITIPTRFLSRFDKSATNIKESSLWLSIGQASPMVHTAFDVVSRICLLPHPGFDNVNYAEKNILSRTEGLSCLSRRILQKQTVIYKASTDDADDPLLNPAHLLVGKRAQNKAIAYQFAKWAVSSSGQKVITSFQKNGQQLYSGAP